MPSKDYTPELLDLKGAINKNIYHTITEIHIHFSMEKKPHTYPKCGSVTESVHDYRDSVIRDIPISGKHTILHYRKRHYRCSCCNKCFYEDFPFSGKYLFFLSPITSILSEYSFTIHFNISFISYLSFIILLHIKRVLPLRQYP